MVPGPLTVHQLVMMVGATLFVPEVFKFVFQGQFVVTISTALVRRFVAERLTGDPKQKLVFVEVLASPTPPFVTQLVEFVETSRAHELLAI
jgi:hypothetical protein